MGVLATAASELGVAEAGLRLFITLLLGYPIGLLHRLYLHRSTPQLQHAAITLTGLALMYFNFGLDSLHSIAAITAVWALLRWLGGRLESVILAFVGLMAHLVGGYWATETDGYDINWTMPHCILTLRLIGLVWDVYDGARSPSQLSKEQSETAIGDRPGLLEVFAYVYYFGAFLVGPQLPLSRFRAWVTGGLGNGDGWESAKRLGAGLVFLLLNLLLSPRFPASMFASPEWAEASLVWKHALSIIWLRIRIFQYQAVWLIAESVCILVGLAQNGSREDGSVRWDGLRNTRIWRFECGCSFQSLIESFNLNTNRWAASYVYKRLKFLGSKAASQVGTLAFLAFWHGWHLGYFVCFAGEFFCMLGEKQATALLARVPSLERLLLGRLWPLTWLACKAIVLGSWAFWFLPFGLLKKERWLPVYASLYWDVAIFQVFAWPLLHFVLSSLLPKPPKNDKPKEQ